MSSMSWHGSSNRRPPPAKGMPVAPPAQSQVPVQALIAEADMEVSSMQRLQDQFRKQRYDARKKRTKLARKVADAMCEHGEQLHRDREKLERALGEQMKRVHELEVQNMDTWTTMREKRQDVRHVARNLISLKRVNVDVADIAGTEFRAMREMHERLENHALSLEDELRVAVGQREQVEARIADCRQMLAINDALIRSRAELPHAVEGLAAYAADLEEEEGEHTP
eukprot:TRINITY_DN102002_c0_g1_i1.p1 TRINITY_DN102002_c0_g1~~TRINITY_DN102002_c0_g1_i1.p1  ORF type:complete len:225 (+),score=58.30 TRINITY_DN102002_c0_g1_i1:130-804(+)